MKTIMIYTDLYQWFRPQMVFKWGVGHFLAVFWDLNSV